MAGDPVVLLWVAVNGYAVKAWAWLAGRYAATDGTDQSDHFVVVANGETSCPVVADVQSGHGVDVGSLGAASGTF